MKRSDGGSTMLDPSHLLHYYTVVPDAFTGEPPIKVCEGRP
jgi:hypothetical protein